MCSSIASCSDLLTSDERILAAASAAESQPAREKMNTIAGSIFRRAKSRSSMGIDGTSERACCLESGRRWRLVRPPPYWPSAPPRAAPSSDLRRDHLKLLPPRPLPWFVSRPNSSEESDRTPYKRSRSAMRRSGINAALSFHARGLRAPPAPGPALGEVNRRASPRSSA
eukprot:scaffold240983_cov30-Tisochrysis_lutea.AAC.4